MVSETSGAPTHSWEVEMWSGVVGDVAVREFLGDSPVVGRVEGV